MTLQQLKYVIAVNKTRNFARAAEECSVTQPTLSAMLMKLEGELGVRIFDRTSKNVTPTSAGEKIIALAEKTLASAARIHSVIEEENGNVSGELRMSIGPTIAPYILPGFISRYTSEYPDVQLYIKDLKASSMLNSLFDGSIDAGLSIAGNTRKGVREIPIYTEAVELYSSPGRDGKGNMDFLWVMKEALSLRESTFRLFGRENKRHHTYEATSIEELIRLVDQQGGSTMIPHMHLRYLTGEQRRNVVQLSEEEMTQRTISLYVKSNLERPQMLHSIINVLKQVIPSSLLHPTLGQIEV